jgi:hypothetical protein
MAAKASPKIIPGAENTMMRLRPIISMYLDPGKYNKHTEHRVRRTTNLSANSVNTKFVPEMMSPTAVGWLNPISWKSDAE